MTSKTAAIALNAFRETVRQPFFCVVLGVAAVSIALSPSFAMFTMLENVRLVKDIGLSTMLLAGLAVAALSAAATVSEELRGKTALMVVSRPVGRGRFVLGKFLGILGAQAVAMWLLTIVLLLTVRVGVPEAAYSKLDTTVLWSEVAATLATLLVAAGANYFFGRSFTASVVSAGLLFFSLCFIVFANVGEGMSAVPLFAGLDLNTLRGAAVLFMLVAVMTAVAVACSTRLALVTTIIVCMLVFVVGMLSDHLLGRFAHEAPVAALLYSLVPNLQAFWMGDALSVNQNIPWAYVASAGGYAALQIAAALLIGVFLFEAREVK